RVNQYELHPTEVAVLTSKHGDVTDNRWTLLAGEPWVLTFPDPPDRSNSQVASFVWTKNGELLPEAKGLTLRFPWLRPSDAGTYVLSVVEPGRTIESMPVKIDVLAWTELPPTRGLRPPPR
ncbi:MAG: hypothetical protein ABIY47_03325, partial [Opitutaceae bacterium]